MILQVNIAEKLKYIAINNVDHYFCLDGDQKKSAARPCSPTTDFFSLDGLKLEVNTC